MLFQLAKLPFIAKEKKVSKRNLSVNQRKTKWAQNSKLPGPA